MGIDKILLELSLPDLITSTVTDSKTAQERHSSIIAELKGQSVVIHDLNAILDGWPREVSQDIDRLRGDVNEWLERYGTCVLVSKLE